jgi:hypothetical protein
MRKILTLLFAFTLFTSSFASSTSLFPPPANNPVAPKKATEVFIPIGKSGQMISLMELSRIDVKGLEDLTGKKMKLTDRIGFKLAQRELKRDINPDGTINSKKLKNYLDSDYESRGFHFGGFALGFFLGLIGVLIAYLINDDKKRARVKWAWLGLAILVGLELIIVLATL